jgi:hypothetical protein
MPTQLRPLDADTLEFLQRLMTQTYLDGRCYELAIALHRGLGWSLVGLQQRTQEDGVETTCIRHAGVMSPDRWFFDARGRVANEDVDTPFGSNLEYVDFELESDLRSHTRPIEELFISQAGKLAMSLWPALPWKKDTYIQSVVTFLNDIEQVCRRHGFWLIAPCGAATWPMIVPAEEADADYELIPNGVGSYVANPKLKSG